MMCRTYFMVPNLELALPEVLSNMKSYKYLPSLPLKRLNRCQESQ